MSARFPIIDVSAWLPDRDEPMGSKRKLWLVDPDKGRWLFKFRRTQPCGVPAGEDWAEKLAAQIARLMGIPCADVEMGRYNGELGSLGRDFIKDRRTFGLIHGNEIIRDLIDPAYPADAKTMRIQEHTVQRVLAALSHPSVGLPDKFPLPEIIQGPAQLFVGYLLLDATISNSDRHHENWGIIVRRGTNNAELAPTFDHASSLGRELSDDERTERLKTKDKNRSLARYAERTPSRFFRVSTERRPLHPREAFQIAAEGQPEAAAIWLQRLGSLSIETLGDVISRVPPESMTAATADFTIALLNYNINALLKLSR